MAGIKFGNKKAAAAAPAAGKSKAATSSNGAKGASLLPEEWVSGGLLNDVDVDLTDLTFVDDWTYNGAVQDPVLALKVTMTDEAGAETIQYLSAGDLARFVPSEDGKVAVPAEGSTATALNNNTNCAAFLGSLMEQGFPKKLVSDRVDVFEGCNVHVNRVPQKKRSGMANADDKQREVLVVTKINSLPGEKAFAAPKGAKAATASPKKGAASAPATASEEGAEISEELATMVHDTVVAVLEEKDGTVPFKTLSLAALKHLAGNTEKPAIIAIIKDAEQLSAVADAMGDFSTDGETVVSA